MPGGLIDARTTERCARGRSPPPSLRPSARRVQWRPELGSKDEPEQHLAGILFQRWRGQEGKRLIERTGSFWNEIHFRLPPPESPELADVGGRIFS